MTRGGPAVAVDRKARIVRIDFPTCKPQYVILTVEEARLLANRILNNIATKRLDRQYEKET